MTSYEVTATHAISNVLTFPMAKLSDDVVSLAIFSFRDEPAAFLRLPSLGHPPRPIR